VIESASYPRLDTRIPRETIVFGGILFRGELIVGGRVCGNIDGVAGSATSVNVQSGALVEGDVRAFRIVIHGRVRGSVVATDRIVVRAGAQVDGDIVYALIEMQFGATVDGRLLRRVPEMTEDPVEP